MNLLKKIALNFDSTFEYVKYNLTGGNTLSHALLNAHIFNHGNFFTFLPQSANLDRLYAFDKGGLLPKGNIKKITVLEHVYQAEIINNSQNALESYINEILKQNALLTAVFEDVLRSPNHSHLESCKSNIVTYNDEVYYILHSKHAENLNLTSQFIQNTNAMWHFLCVLTEIPINNSAKQNKTTQWIQKASRSTQFIVIGAYDGEGYIFWERQKHGIN